MKTYSLIFVVAVLCLALQVTANKKSEWSEWSQWTQCSVTCGSGLRERISYKLDTQGARTNQTFLDMGGCYIDKLCPVDGNWTMWYPWSACDRMCGGGTQIRERQCENPKPRNGGNPCYGPASESQACNPEPCPMIPPDFNIRICVNEDMFMCESKQHCVNKTLRCDKKLNCNDGSDEKQCWKYWRNGQESLQERSIWTLLFTVSSLAVCLLIQR